MPLAVYRCSKCGKELTKSDREFCYKHDRTECSDCSYLSCIGVHTIAEYNAWLKDKHVSPNSYSET